MGYSVAVDASGNSIVTGSVASPTLTFGTYTLTNSTTNVFLSKFDLNGNVLWARCSTGLVTAAGNSVAYDASGNAYIAGYFKANPTITFGVCTLTISGTCCANTNAFLVKYDAAGNALWAKSTNGIYGKGYSVSTYSADVFVTGVMGFTITIGTYTLSTPLPKTTELEK